MWLGWDRQRLVLEIRWWNHPFENCNLAKCDHYHLKGGNHPFDNCKPAKCHHCHPRRWRYVVLGLALLSRARPSVGGRRRLWFNRLPITIISVLIFFTIVIVPLSSKCYALDINVFLLPSFLMINDDVGRYLRKSVPLVLGLTVVQWLVLCQGAVHTYCS